MSAISPLCNPMHARLVGKKHAMEDLPSSGETATNSSVITTDGRVSTRIPGTEMSAVKQSGVPNVADPGTFAKSFGCDHFHTTMKAAAGFFLNVIPLGSLTFSTATNNSNSTIAHEQPQ